MKRMKKNKRRGFTVVECVAAILVITIVTACAIGIFRTALSTGEDNWNNYLADAIVENALAAFQSSESAEEFDEIIREVMVKTAEDRLTPVIEITHGGAAESSLSDVMLPVHFTKVRATEAEQIVAFYNGETPILTLQYNENTKYVSDKAALNNAALFEEQKNEQASLGTITVKGNGGGSGEGSESTAVEEKIELFIGFSKSSTAKQFTVTYDTKNSKVTYASKDGKTTKTCAMTDFEKYLLENGIYLSPKSGTYTTSGSSTGQAEFYAYYLTDNTAVTRDGQQLCFKMSFTFSTGKFLNDTSWKWNNETQTVVTYLAYRYEYDSDTTWKSTGLPQGFKWDYYPAIACLAGNNTDTKNHYFTRTAYTLVPGSKTWSVGFDANDTSKQYKVSINTTGNQVTYTPKNGGSALTATMSWFEKDLYSRGLYLVPSNAWESGTNQWIVVFDVYDINTNCLSSDTSHNNAASFRITFGSNIVRDNWKLNTDYTASSIIPYTSKGGSGSSGSDLVDGKNGHTSFSWMYLPYIAYQAKKSSTTSLFKYQYDFKTASGTATFDIIAQSEMEIALTKDTVSISSKTGASDDSSAENRKSATHSKQAGITPFEKALFDEGYFLYYDANCFRAGGSYLYFYIWDVETKTYVKDETGNSICYRVSGARHGSGQWYDGNYFTASKIESAALAQRAGDYTGFPSSGWTDVTANYEGMTGAEWYFAAYMMDTCSFDSADMTTVDIAVAHDFVCFDSEITVTADGSAVPDLIYTDYLPNGENGVIYYALAKTGEIKLYSASIIAEDTTPIFVYTDTRTSVSALEGLVDGAAHFKAEGAFGESGYTLYCSRDRLRIEKVRLLGSSILFLQNVGDEEITVFSFTYDNPNYADDDFAAIKSEGGVYRSRYKTIGAIEATLADEYAAGYARLHWDDETGFYSIMIYPSAEATEGGVEIFASSDSVPGSDYCDLKKDKEVKQTITVQDATEICFYQYIPNGGKYASVIRVQYSHSYGDSSVEPRITIWKLPSRLLGSKQALGKDIKQIDNAAYDKYVVISYRKG